MTYQVRPLARSDFEPLFAMDDAALAAVKARRVIATGPGFPCRVSLEEAEVGERLILVNHVSHVAATPYRASHAVYVRESAQEAHLPADTLPPVFAGRWLSLRGFDAEGMMADARLAAPGEADAAIRALFASSGIDYVHAHNAVPGCYSARIERAGS
jgi:hypothetical protein